LEIVFAADEPIVSRLLKGSVRGITYKHKVSQALRSFWLLYKLLKRPKP
jgi:hypothetical protein